jgi:hypothetical protein
MVLPAGNRSMRANISTNDFIHGFDELISGCEWNLNPEIFAAKKIFSRFGQTSTARKSRPTSQSGNKVFSRIVKTLA